MANTLTRKFIPWFRPLVGDDELNRLRQVIHSGYINDGFMVRDFERKLADRIGTEYAVCVTSGTAAIALALMGLGVGPGDEVLVPNLTFIATRNAVLLTGATVRFVDVDERLTIDVEEVKKNIRSNTKAVVSVDVNGRGCRYETLVPFLKSKRIGLVTDSCEALGSGYKGKPLGSYGDAGCFSFSANKTVTMGQGGAVVTNNEFLFKRIKELKDQGRRTQGSGGDDLHPTVGFNFKLTNLQAAVGVEQLDKLDIRLKNSWWRDHFYKKYLAGKGFKFIKNYIDEITQWTDVVCENRPEVEKKLKENNIDYRNYWLPLHTQSPLYHEELDKGKFPVSEKASEKMLWLPSSFDLTEEDVKYIAGVL